MQRPGGHRFPVRFFAGSHRRVGWSQPPFLLVFTVVSTGSKPLLGTLFRPPTAPGLSFSGPDARSAGQVIRDSKACLKWRVVG
jgi:hypothetical protein